MERNTLRVKAILALFGEGRTFAGERIPACLIRHEFDGQTLTLRLDRSCKSDVHVQAHKHLAGRMWPGTLKVIWATRE